ARDMHATVKQAEFETLEGAIVPRGGIVLIQPGSLFSSGSVVANQEHECIVATSRLLQCAAHSAYAGIGRGNHCSVHLPLRGERRKTGLVLVRGMHWIMRSIECDVGEERLVAALQYELRRLIGDPLGQVLAIFEDLGTISPEIMVVDVPRLSPIITVRVI